MKRQTWGIGSLSLVILAVVAAAGVALRAVTPAYAAINGTLASFTPVETVAFSGTVATFTDMDATCPTDTFTATINWGDTTSSAGTVSNSNGGTQPCTITVDASGVPHTYAEDGPYTVTVTLTDTTTPASGMAAGTVTVGEGSFTLAGVPPIAVAEGTAFNGTVATFVDPGSPDAASAFTATIDWGDGTTSTATAANGGITGSAGSYTVTGMHTYQDELSGGNINVTVNEPAANFSLGPNPDNLTVTEADTLVGTPATFFASPGVSGTFGVATFTDTGFPGNVAGDFTATIDWGDATTSAGTVSGGGGTFSVSGTHTYAGAGTFPVVVTLSDDAPGTATAQTTSTAHVNTPSADLQVTKTGPATATAGQTVSYTIAVANNGPDDAQTVTLSDTLPGTETFVSLTQNSGPTFSCTVPAVGAGGTVTCTVATLTNGSTASFTLVAHVPAGTASGSTLSNTASVSSSTTDPTPGNNSSTATTTVTTSADLAVTKTGPASVNAGQQVTYTIMVTNTGPSDAQGVTLTDTLPAGETFVSASEGTAVGNSYTDTIGTLANGATHTITLVAQVSASAVNGSTLSNTASVSSTTPDPASGNNSGTAMTTVSVPSISSCSVNPTVLPKDGALHTVTVTINTNGPFTLQSVTSNEPIVAGTDYTFVPGTMYPAGTTMVSGSLKGTVSAGSHGRQYVLTFVPSGPAAGTSCQVTVQVRLR